VSGPKPAAPGESAGESGDDGESNDTSVRTGEGLSDLDCHSLLSRDGFGGSNGLSLAEYGALSDRQIFCLLRVEWDEDGKLVREERPAGRQPTGAPSRAKDELPSQAELGLDERMMEEALWLRPLAGPYYVRMFWSVHRKRGRSPEEIAELYRDHVRSRN
jgi:hypothetical protein